MTEENLKSVRRGSRSGDWGAGEGEGGERIRSRGSLERGTPWGGGERGSKALATGFTPVESRHLSVRTCFSKNVRFSTEKRNVVRPRSFSPSPSPYLPSIPPLFLSSRLTRLFLVPVPFSSLPFSPSSSSSPSSLGLSVSLSLSLSPSLPPWLRVDEREEDSFLCFAGNRFLSYVKLQDGSSTFLPRGSLFLLLPKFIGGNVLFTL